MGYCLPSLYRDDRGGGGGGFRRPPSDVERMTSLRVGNLPYSAEAEDISTLFKKYGDVGDVYFPKERDTGRSRGFAFVRYYDKNDAEDAVEGLNGRSYDGRELRISLDAGRPGGGGFGGGFGGGRRRSRSRSRDRRRRSRSNSGGRRRSRSHSGGRDRSRSRRRDSKKESRSKSRGRDSRSRSRS